MTDFLHNRNGKYYYLRRVPRHLKKYDSRREIKISLKTSDRAEAARRSLIQNEAVEKYWSELVKNPQAGRSHDAYREAVSTARAHGFAYRSIAQLAEGPLPDLVERLRALQPKDQGNFAAAAPALLGGVEQPKVRISAALEQYFSLTAGDHSGKAGAGKKKSHNRTRRAIRNFIASAGDIPFAEISRRHILDFRNWWTAKIADQELHADTANKDLNELKKVLRTVALENQVPINLKALFEDTRFSFKARSRPPFDISFVQAQILGPGMLDGLNPEARAIVYIVAETGARPKEILFLDFAADVDLSAEVPFIHIRPNRFRQQLKTDPSERRIPITPLTRLGLQLIGDGVTRYQDEDELSATVNKFFAENKMKPTPEHTFYSLRHTFKDRLVDAGAPEAIIDDLMGHKSVKPKYGRGHMMPAKLEWMQKIAFKPPVAAGKPKK